MKHTAPSHPKIREWRHRLLLVVAGLLIFETLTGLSIYLLPFSVSNQVMVLLHTGIGLLFILPFAWYQLRHWRLYRQTPMTHIKLTGYFSMGTTLVAAVSGLVLTIQALFQVKISYGWDLIHILSTFALIAALLPHVIVIVVRDFKARTNSAIKPILSAAKTFGVNTMWLVVGLFAVLALLVYAYEPVQLNNQLPEDYNYLYGEDRPFAPSLAQTSTGDAFDARSLGGSQSCGRAGCHSEIVKEWEVSAHRWSAMDPAFRAVQRTMGEQNGPESTRYCGGCHDPISLFSGTKNLFRDDLTNPIGFDEGISCIACHSIKETDVQGNANYTLTQPERYLFELRENKTAQFITDFLIRAYPKQHVESLQHRLFKSPEFCAACHKQFIDEEINNVGWVQLQNQYDNWRKSRWNHPGDPEKTVECRECHMPLVASLDPASGDPLDYNRTPNDEKHRSHRFLGANQFVPKLLNLHGADEQIALTEQWLRGEFDIPEIAHKWKTGPAVPIELIAPDQVAPGDDVAVAVVVTNNKLGHDFPTGPLDIIQAWVEVVVTDQEGREVFTTGRRDEQHFIQPGSFIFKAEPVDQYGNLIDRHNLWEMVGVRYRRALFPGFSDKAEFVFSCPATLVAGNGEDTGQAGYDRGRYPDAEPEEGSRSESFALHVPEQNVTTLQVTARLLYRKIDQFLLNELFGAESGMTSSVTVISEDQKEIAVIAGN